MRIRRYPLAAQIVIAAWFPLVAIATAELEPTTALTCRRAPSSGAVACMIDERTLLQRRRLPVEPTSTAVKLFFGGPDPLGIGRERFDVSITQAERAQLAYDRFRRTPAASSLVVPIRSTEWLSLLCGIAELFVFLFYAVAQVRTRLEADLDEGTVAIERRRRLRRNDTRRIVLADVASFRVDDLTDDAQGHAVVARLRSGEERILLTTVSAGAVQALRFLQSAKDRATA